MLKKNKLVKPKLNEARPSLIETLLAAPKLPQHEWRRAFRKRPRTLTISHFRRWQLQEAKAKFSALFEDAMKKGPQVVTRRNKDAVVIISHAEFAKLADAPDKPRPNMLEVLLHCPKGPDLQIHRDEAGTILDAAPIFD